jgi:hypothetical protein
MIGTISAGTIEDMKMLGWRYDGICNCSERAHIFKKGGSKVKVSVRSGVWNRWKGNRLQAVGNIENLIQLNTGIQ